MLQVITHPHSAIQLHPATPLSSRGPPGYLYGSTLDFETQASNNTPLNLWVKN